MYKAQGGLSETEECTLNGSTLFISIIINAQIPYKFKQPQLDQYDGKGDPITYILMFKTKMML